MRWVRMLSGLLSAAFGRREAADKPVRRPWAAKVKMSGYPDAIEAPGNEAAEARFRAHGWDPAQPDGTRPIRSPDTAEIQDAVRQPIVNGLRRLFRGRGINVRNDGQLLAAVEDACRELDAIRARVGESLLRDAGLANYGTPGSDESPGWTGHDDDDDDYDVTMFVEDGGMTGRLCRTHAVDHV